MVSQSPRDAGLPDRVPTPGGARLPSRARLLSPSAIGQANRGKLLELLHRKGPTSRAQLARELQVGRATVATILQPLIDDGTLVEGEVLASSSAGGKPARPLWFNPDGAELGAMRVAPTGVTVARLGFDGRIRSRRARAVRTGAGLDDFESAINELAHACFDGHRLLGIGIAASGMINTRTGTILSLHLAPVLSQYPIADLLGRRFGVPVIVDHHPRVQALGDQWFGAGRLLPHFASVYTGEALGFGIVHDGEIIRGEDGAGGEYGHTVVDMNGEPCLCGRTGCWETVATTGWLRREARRVGLDAPDSVDSGRLAAGAAAGDQAATGLLDRYAQNLAIGLANNEHMLGSGTYILHGDACRGGQLMEQRLTEWLTEFSPHRGDPPTVIMAGADDDMTLLGGGGLVLSTVLGGRTVVG
ncbi:ROK family transcriptional regulator [Microlunatus soli]|uniref:Sugar kinase of the NBD/HSP70 family, may contain an N-terminal HTH domain n=1 Tax=Microlunatus soli TaxID=630515 RepID=A0A1H1RQJ0_9ACTN|nr:ROK family transcriptional regulator [Microlunatus soli]SDS37978.1 Sugar kinase of the NBD/HSP70 family, may contain an N-terminal HTH domain [Microlunatus soli]